MRESKINNQKNRILRETDRECASEIETFASKPKKQKSFLHVFISGFEIKSDNKRRIFGLFVALSKIEEMYRFKQSVERWPFRRMCDLISNIVNRNRTKY